MYSVMARALKFRNLCTTPQCKLWVKTSCSYAIGDCAVTPLVCSHRLCFATNPPTDEVPARSTRYPAILGPDKGRQSGASSFMSLTRRPKSPSARMARGRTRMPRISSCSRCNATASRSTPGGTKRAFMYSPPKRTRATRLGCRPARKRARRRLCQAGQGVPRTWPRTAALWEKGRSRAATGVPPGSRG